MSLVAGAAVSLALEGADAPLVWAGIAAGGALQGTGWLVSHGASRERRLFGWELQALGLAVLAASWFYGMAA